MVMNLHQSQESLSGTAASPKVRCGVWWLCFFLLFFFCGEGGHLLKSSKESSARNRNRYGLCILLPALLMIQYPVLFQFCVFV